MAEVNEALQKAAEQFAINLEKYPIEEQMAIAAISKNVLNGCSWEFVRNTSDLRKKLDAFKKSKYCELKTVTYSHDKNLTGYLVLMNLQRLVSILEKEGMGVFNKKDLQEALNHRAEAVQNCAKLMKKGYKGRIGIFCTNDSSTITVDGVSYPAFAVTINELCDIASKMGYGFKVGGAVRSPNEVKSVSDSVIKCCIVAPSSNALFVDIAPMR